MGSTKKRQIIHFWLIGVFPPSPPWPLSTFIEINNFSFPFYSPFPNDLIYHIRCICVAEGGFAYVGSTNNMKKRWTTHKSDIRNGRWTACGLTRHFGQHHPQDIETHIDRLQITLLVSCEEEVNLKKLEDKCMCNLGTLFHERGLNSRNEVMNNKRRNFGES